MSDPQRQPERTPAHWPPDSELKVKTVVIAGFALAAATALSAVAMWYFSIGLKERMEARDPAPPALLEAQMPHEPPSPRLETQPVEQLRALRAEENEALTTYGWVDESAGIARVPIERGMELLLETRPDGRAFAAPAGAAPPAAAAPSEPARAAGDAMDEQGSSDE